MKRNLAVSLFSGFLESAQVFHLESAAKVVLQAERVVPDDGTPASLAEGVAEPG
jgi:hypothetical protein